jgi:uncharacterized protein DUF6600/FecR-like protein
MASRLLLSFGVILLGTSLLLGANPAIADSSHARIIRLSLVQGDVRFTRDAHGDPLTDEKAVWETAVLNLPIRQGYVLATDHGRAEVEFENGAMGFLSENTVLEFYDLSLDDGARTTRLVLRQGTASFYVNPGGDDYFSVTGGDFTVEAAGRTSFRLDNFDDGSNVNVTKGRVKVLHKKSTTPLDQGQSLSMRAGDDSSLNVGRLPDNDDFDRWVSGRVESVVTATNAATQYTSAPYTYSSGFADLYTYGSWFPVSGYGYCWRPYGVGMGWSPFSYGNWYYDPFFGWTFLGNQPWGWLPFHYGGWLFQPGFGFLWSPFGFGGVRGPVRYRPVTGVFVHSGDALALVPSHPMDVRGKTPINLAQGAFPVSGGRISESLVAGTGAEWRTLKQPPREALSGAIAASAPPERLSRTVLASNAGARVVTFSKYSSIVYDPQEHRFVNNTGLPVENKTEKNSALSVENERVGSAKNEISADSNTAPGLPAGAKRTFNNNGASNSTGTPQAAWRPTTTPPAPRAVTPPPAPRSGSFGGERGGSGGGSSRGGSAPSHPSAAPSGRPH